MQRIKTWKEINQPKRDWSVEILLAALVVIGLLGTCELQGFIN